MSQAELGDSSLQENVQEHIASAAPISSSPLSVGDSSAEIYTRLSTLPRQVLEQELYFCNERSQQAQVLLRQAQEQLQLSQLVIQRQETLTQTLQSRIDQLERELQDVHSNCDELRDRLKRQQHHTSQLKAALERCLDTANPAANQTALSALESWSVAKLSDEKIAPVGAVPDSPLQNVVKITPAGDRPEVTSALQSAHISQPEPLASLDVETPESPMIATSFTPVRSQPISPLIVRPHKAYQGSPIAVDLPKLQQDIPQPQHSAGMPSAAIPTSEPKLSLGASDSTHDLPQSTFTADRAMHYEVNNATGASADIAPSTVLNTVTAPKFMRSLYAQSYAQSQEPTEETDLAIAAASSRKPATLAAVQLPQFPPLPRR